MVVKILSSSASFRGVEYNTDKIDKGRGELMHVANFGPLEGLNNLRPEDYKNYLRLVSSQNKKIENPQLHVAISCLGREYDEHQLTEIGKDWLKEMGYNDNPYLIVYHKDTDNNHVHLVSTRVDKQGKKINSDYERIRAMKAINRIVGLNESQNVTNDIKKSLNYNFKTKAQFFLLLEKMDYVIKPTEQGATVIKYGNVLTEIGNNDIEARLNTDATNTKRLSQIRAIIEKYKLEYSPKLYPKTITTPSGEVKEKGFTSELADHLKEKFGIDLVFHAKGNKKPYGFSIIDNAQKNVFKGGEVITLKELLENKITPEVAVKKVQDPYKLYMDNRITSVEGLAYYKTLVHSVINSYGFLQEGLRHQGFDLVNTSNDLFIIDIQGNASIKLGDLLPEKSEDYQKLAAVKGHVEPEGESLIQGGFADISFGGADIDDEAILGRNRARKVMARTNRR